ncbi:amino acid ABC transporter permease [Veillonella magna]|uniref:Amino acid ABC transporter permease n=1 Tax=Veillonella magna TaxID=464322 RepID=A0ABS2GEC7_9FIRM|nr:amino acid ABC transporter permease [Veillonella magna]MBM6824068.1 amino acid ABC transporter permease [Veillonella magna]MBM6912361.1 amino acid ABC transporter permease [Veillonella magna]
MDYLLHIVPIISEGLEVTVSLFFVVLVLSLPSGILLAMLRLSPLTIVRRIVEFYVYIMRGTPLMLQILFIYYGLPFIPYIGVQLDAPTAAVISFVLNYAAYLCEIFRGGIQSIPKGQYEGAKVLGFTYVQTMRKIILPQVIKRVLPPLANETINLLKDTSLVYILAMNDVLRITRGIVQRDFDTSAFIVAGVFYLIMTFVLTNIFNYLEKRYAVYDE